MSKGWGSSGYSHHFIADFIISHFPESFLQEIGDIKKTYEIFYSEKKLLCIDIKGVTYFFPNRYRENRWGWDGIIEGSPEAVAEIILQDLADYDFTTFDKRGRQIIKRQIRLDKNIVCVNCGAVGSIKRYFYGIPGTSRFAIKLAKDRVILGRGRKKGDQEALCTKCDWTGSTEIYRFLKKKL